MELSSDLDALKLPKHLRLASVVGYNGRHSVRDRTSAIVAGIVVALAAKSAIHEIPGSIAFGMGVLSAGLAAIVSKLSAMQSASEKQAALFQSILDSRNP